MDIDIDLPNREDLLSLIEHIPASRIQKEELLRHPVGVYFQTIPTDPESGLASIPYEQAEERGWVKIDLLNNSLYQGVRSEEHLLTLLHTEPDWTLLEHEEVVSQLAHINGHFEIVKQMRPTSITQLAMVIAMIRPGKRHLVGKRWAEIEKEIWVPTEEYYFKHSHSVSYAASIVVQLNLLVETLTQASSQE
jgi:hypothetical protein